MLIGEYLKDLIWNIYVTVDITGSFCKAAVRDVASARVHSFCAEMQRFSPRTARTEKSFKILHWPTLHCKTVNMATKIPWIWIFIHHSDEVEGGLMV